MEDRMDEAKKRSKCREFLVRRSVAVMATASPDDQPHAAAINYLVNDDLHVFFIAREGSRKYANITRNPLVWIVVSDPQYISSVEIAGPAYQIKNEDKALKLLGEFSSLSRRDNPWPMPVMTMHGSEIHLFELHPRHVTYSDFRPTHPHGGERFELNFTG
jgi:nitroimidazol reductase NimA-like FMN-containing flavoprotein (pyridoxamine 5'-phosphate oxidase superfamily)